MTLACTAAPVVAMEDCSRDAPALVADVGAVASQGSCSSGEILGTRQQAASQPILAETLAGGEQPAKGEVRQLRIEGAMAYFGAGRFQDERGFYEEIDFKTSGVETAQQTGFSCSERNVLRGIHCSPYGKIVSCLSGEMWDCMVDLRPHSPTFMAWDAVLLSPERRSRIYVPPGVGHSFLALKDGTTCLYVKFGRFDPSKEMEVNAFDPAIGIRWPEPLGDASEYIISKKDRNLPTVEEALAKRRLSGQAHPEGLPLKPGVPSEEPSLKRARLAPAPSGV